MSGTTVNVGIESNEIDVYIISIPCVCMMYLHLDIYTAVCFFV